MALEAADVVIPELPVLLGPVGHGLDSFGLELVDALPAFPLLAHEPRAAQHAEVPGDGGTADPKPGHEIIDWCTALSKAIENRPASGVGDSVEDIGIRGNSGHEI